MTIVCGQKIIIIFLQWHEQQRQRGTIGKKVKRGEKATDGFCVEFGVLIWVKPAMFFCKNTEENITVAKKKSSYCIKY